MRRITVGSSSSSRLGQTEAPPPISAEAPAGPPTVARDGLDLSPRARAHETARAYAAAAGSDRPLEAKRAVFEARFHPDVQFRDPIFGSLEGRQVFGKLEIEHSGSAQIRYAPVRPEDVRPMTRDEIAELDPAAAERGEAWMQVDLRWNADYELGGNAIRNEVSTQLHVDADGKIRGQTDAYDPQRWMDQALPGLPEGIRRSGALRWVANQVLGAVTYFKG